MARRAVKFVLSDALVTESIYRGGRVLRVRGRIMGIYPLLKSNKRFHGITGRRGGLEGLSRIGLV